MSMSIDIKADQELDHDTARCRVGADICQRRDAQRKDPSRAVEGELGAARDVASVACRQEFVDALGSEPDGTPELARRKGDDDILGIQARLHAEAAPDVADEHAHVVAAAAEHFANLVAKAGRRLATDPERETAGGRVMRRERRARLDRRRRDTLVDEVQRHDVRSAREGRFRIASIAVSRHAGHVVRRAGNDDSGTGGDRRVDVDHRRQRVVVDLDPLGGVACLVQRRGDDGRHRFADETNGVDGKRVPGRGGRRRPIGTPVIGRRRDRLHTGVGEITTRDDRRDAGQLRRGFACDAPDAGVRVGRAHEAGVQLIGRRNVVGEAALAAQKGVILDALD